MRADEIRNWLGRPADVVGPQLLGWRVSHTTAEGTVSVELTEVEAYLGESDPASHAFAGRTKRNAVMFGRAGHLYVYRSHGLHWCSNVVTGQEGVASAVLLRAGRVVVGHDLAAARRGPGVVRAEHLARGPGCLCRALGISDTDYGADLLSGRGVYLEPGSAVQPLAVLSGPRVGVARGREAPLRYWIAGDRTVSAYRAHPRREQRDRTP